MNQRKGGEMTEIKLFWIEITTFLVEFPFQIILSFWVAKIMYSYRRTRSYSIEQRNEVNGQLSNSSSNSNKKVSVTYSNGTRTSGDVSMLIQAATISTSGKNSAVHTTSDFSLSESTSCDSGSAGE